ncbi:hydantoinase/oxoprolinase N-terminal domain-containing protein [Candidatus Poriferisodalis sp.]|uniref:hydantoinase/oxoprolinase N-terminal domain-containing protein n=1 Tax=Candidatus Poriferisodalis sp. TaxID=3101277 RepID=UPI003B01D434
MPEPLGSPSGRFSLGIDTGGTFTDAVIYSRESGVVVATAKTPTRHGDLFGCVVEAMKQVLDAVDGVSATDIGLVSVSTTLATNALVEGAGRPAALVSIGFDAEHLARAGLRTAGTTGLGATNDDANGAGTLAKSLAAAPVVMLAGGHGAHGDEIFPLDIGALAAGVDRVNDDVDAYAVAAQFSVRNAAHELAAREAIRERTGKPVTCSHELSPRLGGPRRAVTTLLNAQLISVTSRFVNAIGDAMSALELDAPLMVVRGDGSLVSGDFVSVRPIETILSGPAASVIGARRLAAAELGDGSGLETSCVIADIGGTTTDIASIRDGVVVGAAAGSSVERDGAVVGGHATMVTALPMTTVGLGGDSEIWIPPEGDRGEIAVGPRRVVPLCIAAREHPDVVVPMLTRQLEADRVIAEHGQLLMLIAEVPPAAGLDTVDVQVLDLIGEASGVLALDELRRSARWRSAIGRLERRGVVRRAAMTPTDACAVLGLLDDTDFGDPRGARLGAELFSRQRDRYGAEVGADGPHLATHIVQTLLRSAAESILAVALGADGITPAETRRPLAQTALDRRRQAATEARPADPMSPTAAGNPFANPLWGLLDPNDAPAVSVADDPSLARTQSAPLARIDIGVAVPVVAIGAPAVTYAPAIAALLGTTAIVPPHAEVANAVGAATARVRITKEITITAPRRGSYRAHWGEDPPTWHSLDEARAWATTQASNAARAEAAAAGAPDAEITLDWDARTAPSGDRELFVEATLRVIATGRPAGR